MKPKAAYDERFTMMLSKELKETLWSASAEAGVSAATLARVILSRAFDIKTVPITLPELRSPSYDLAGSPSQHLPPPSSK